MTIAHYKWEHIYRWINYADEEQTTSLEEESSNMSA